MLTCCQWRQDAYDFLGAFKVFLLLDKYDLGVQMKQAHILDSKTDARSNILLVEQI